MSRSYPATSTCAQPTLADILIVPQLTNAARFKVDLTALPRIREVNAAPRFSPVPVKSDLTWEEFSKVNLHAAELPGVMADMNDARYYPFGGSFAHVIGYVAKVSDRDVKAIRDKGEQPPALLFNPSFRIGRQGV